MNTIEYLRYVILNSIHKSAQIVLHTITWKPQSNICRGAHRDKRLMVLNGAGKEISEYIMWEQRADLGPEPGPDFRVGVEKLPVPWH